MARRKCVDWTIKSHCKFQILLNTPQFWKSLTENIGNLLWLGINWIISNGRNNWLVYWSGVFAQGLANSMRNVFTADTVTVSHWMSFQFYLWCLFLSFVLFYKRSIDLTSENHNQLNFTLRLNNKIKLHSLNHRLFIIAKSFFAEKDE